jgi:hypothetical protein
VTFGDTVPLLPIPAPILTWASSDFFPGEGKNFPGGQEPTFCLKSNEKDTIFPKKSLKTYYFWPARGGGQGPPLALPCGRPCILKFHVSFKYPISTKKNTFKIMILLLSIIFPLHQDLLGKVAQLGADINRGDNSLSKGTAKRILTNKAKPTVSDAFRLQLQVLVEVLQSTNSW